MVFGREGVICARGVSRDDRQRGIPFQYECHESAVLRQHVLDRWNEFLVNHDSYSVLLRERQTKNIGDGFILCEKLVSFLDDFSCVGICLLSLTFVSCRMIMGTSFFVAQMSMRVIVSFVLKPLQFRVAILKSFET